VAEPVREKAAGGTPLTRFHQRLLAEELALKGGRATDRLASALSEAQVDLNPHQVEAAAFALESLPRGGCVFADEVGLGKTIEAGIVLAQRVAEERSGPHPHPATLGRSGRRSCREIRPGGGGGGRPHRPPGHNPFDQPVPVISSHPFAAGRAELVRQLPWDLVVIDEAHRLRNAHRAGNKIARALRDALRDRPKLLLTATRSRTS
jgi:hypothetical protein